VQHAADKPHASAPLLVLDSVLAGLFVSGVVGTVINMVPLTFLPGSRIRSWHRGAWAATSAIAMFLLIDVMLLPAAREQHVAHAPAVTTAALFVVFGIVSIAFNRYWAARKAYVVVIPEQRVAAEADAIVLPEALPESRASTPSP